MSSVISASSPIMLLEERCIGPLLPPERGCRLRAFAVATF
jgi:hypothetical protein